MKRIIARSLALPAFIWCMGISAAENGWVTLDQRVFPEPAEYCFDELAVRGKSDAVILEYNLIIKPEEYFKRADVFVAATFKSKPGAVLMTEGFYWYDINHVSLGPVPYRSFDRLQPITPISVFYEPADVTAAVGDGQIWIGYGFRAETENSRVSYDEMIRNGRFKLIWKAGNLGAEVDGAVNKICLTTTGMTITTGVAGIASHKSNVP